MRKTLGEATVPSNSELHKIPSRTETPHQQYLGQSLRGIVPQADQTPIDASRHTTKDNNFHAPQGPENDQTANHRPPSFHERNNAENRKESSAIELDPIQKKGQAVEQSHLSVAHNQFSRIAEEQQLETDSLHSLGNDSSMSVPSSLASDSPSVSSWPSISYSPSALPNNAPPPSEPTSMIISQSTGSPSASAAPSSPWASSSPSARRIIDTLLDLKTCTASELASFLLTERFGDDQNKVDIFLRRAIGSLNENHNIVPTISPTESDSISQSPSSNAVLAINSLAPTEVTSTSSSPSTVDKAFADSIEPSTSLQPSTEVSSLPSSSQAPSSSMLPSSHSPTWPYASESPNPTAAISEFPSESIEPSVSLNPSQEPSHFLSQSQQPSIVTIQPQRFSDIPSLLPSESESNVPSYRQSSEPSSTPTSSHPSERPSLAPQTHSPSIFPTSTQSSEPSTSVDPSASPTLFCPKPVQAKHRQKHEKWITYKTLTLDCLDQELRGTEEEVEPAYSVYGGRLDQRVDNGTGFFDVLQDENGRWTLLDPEGYEFVSVGMNSVGPNAKYELYQEGFEQQFNSSDRLFAQKTFDLFQDLGINTLGSWSDDKLFKDPRTVRLPYTPRWNFLLTYKNIRPSGYINIYKEPIPVFEPEFETFAMEHAQQIAAYKDDPYVLGHFSDNEMPFHADNLLHRFLELNATDPGHQAAQKWLAENEKTADEVTNDDHAAFCVVMVERYYSVVHNAIKTYDPNHLFLGSRVHGRVSGQDCSFIAASKYVDVISGKKGHSALKVKMQRSPTHLRHTFFLQSTTIIDGDLNTPDWIDGLSFLDCHS